MIVLQNYKEKNPSYLGKGFSLIKYTNYKFQEILILILFSK